MIKAKVQTMIFLKAILKKHFAHYKLFVEVITVTRCRNNDLE